MERYNFSMIVFVLLGAVIIHFTHLRLNIASSKFQSESSSTFLPTPQSARLVSLGFDQILADAYWLQFISYIGDTQAREVDRYASADRYIDLVTGLDPHFIQAYWFAAFTVGSDQHRPERAAELLDRGIQANPDNWYLPYIAGTNQFLYANNDREAVKYYRMAAKFPGAPSWLGPQADILATDSPRLVKQAYSWLRIFESSGDSMVKEHAREESIKLWIRVFKTAPNQNYRNSARDALRSCGVKIEEVVSKKKLH